MDVADNLLDLKQQLKNAEIIYYKILGAIEALENMEEKNSSSKTKK